MSQAEKWVAAAMVASAACGTLWYLYLEFQSKEPASWGWSIVIFIWFMVIRRLLHLRQNHTNHDPEEQD